MNQIDTGYALFEMFRLQQAMVINTHHQFIFVHIPKAAGTSVMRALQGLRGNNRRLLARTKHETLAQFEQNIGSRFMLLDWILRRNPKSYFTFGFVRNPWDRMASLYRYLVEKRPRQEIDSISGFKEFLIQARDGVAWIQDLYSMQSQLDYFTFPDNQMKIDFLGHFEHLDEDVDSVSRAIGVTFNLSHKNRSANTGDDYRQAYDHEMIEIVASRYAEEIELFGYSFEARSPSRRCSDHLNRVRMTRDAQERIVVTDDNVIPVTWGLPALVLNR